MATKTRTKGLGKVELLKELRYLINICIVLVDDVAKGDHKEIADLMGVHVSTVNRIWRGKSSLFMRVGTLQRLVTAAGLSLKTTDRGYKIRLID